jgi:hypothetical protein
MPSNPSPTKAQIEKVLRNQQPQLKGQLAAFFNTAIPGTTLSTSRIKISATRSADNQVCWTICVNTPSS